MTLTLYVTTHQRSQKGTCFGKHQKELLPTDLQTNYIMKILGYNWQNTAIFLPFLKQKVQVDSVLSKLTCTYI